MAVYWDKNLPNTLRMDIPRNQTWQEYDAMVDEMLEAIASVYEPTDLIVSREDLYEHTGASPHIRRTLEICISLNQLHWVIYILPRQTSFPSVILKSLLILYAPDERERWHFVANAEAAYELIQQHRANR